MADTDDSNTNRSVHEGNIETLVSYFKSGIKPNARELGIELEQIIVRKDHDLPVSYSEEHGIKWLLEQLESDYPIETRDSHGDLLGLARQDEAITLEPAAQVELSAGPFDNLLTAQSCFEAFSSELTSVLDAVDSKALALGYHPTTQAKDLELIPKRRYKFMNFYLGNISDYGPYMMRGTASTQISIDYTSVDDCLRKLRLANALVPILSLITDNTPYFEGKSRPHGLMRTEIWRYCDPDRCGQVPAVMEKDFSLEQYAEYVLRTPAILVPCKKNEWCYTEDSFAKIYKDHLMDTSEVEHALSMLFNDVRLKTYIEIRPGDAMPLPYVIAYAALIKGLFYSPSNLDLMDNLFSAVRASDIEDAKDELMESEYQATIYGRPVVFFIDALFEAAFSGLSANEQVLLGPLAELAERRTTLAQQVLSSRI